MKRICYALARYSKQNQEKREGKDTRERRKECGWEDRGKEGTTDGIAVILCFLGSSLHPYTHTSFFMNQRNHAAVQCIIALPQWRQHQESRIRKKHKHESGGKEGRKKTKEEKVWGRHVTHTQVRFLVHTHSFT